MPKNLFQNVIFTLMMSFLMVYVMICYNISLNIGGMSNKVFLMAFGEMKNDAGQSHFYWNSLS